jgi:hypothetical protein
LSHLLYLVRKSAISAIEKLVSDQESCTQWVQSLPSELLLLVFQNILLEIRKVLFNTQTNLYISYLQECRDISLNTWKKLLACHSAHQLHESLKAHIANMHALLLTHHESRWSSPLLFRYILTSQPHQTY